MPRQVSFRPLAQSDVNSAISWYGEERPAIAVAFIEALDVIIDRIRETPLQFPVVRGKVRRALLGRFPYGVFFVVDEEHIDVLAVIEGLGQRVEMSSDSMIAVLSCSHDLVLRDHRNGGYFQRPQFEGREEDLPA
jgi:plasmid stabilization system protein ParE